MIKLIQSILCLFTAFTCCGQDSTSTQPERNLVPREVYISDLTGDTCIGFCGEDDIRELYKMKLRAEFADSLETYHEKQMIKHALKDKLQTKENLSLRTDVKNKDSTIAGKNSEISRLRNPLRIAKTIGISFVIGVLITVFLTK